MNQLSDLPNIGKVLERKLKEVGIESPDQLIALGSEQAYLLLQALNDGCCINMLCALEGAIQGIRWHNLPIDRKKELKEFIKLKRI